MRDVVWPYYLNRSPHQPYTFPLKNLHAMMQSFSMESLLCNEVFEEDDYDVAQITASFQDCEEALAAFLPKDLPQLGYTNLLQIDDFVAKARFKGVTWIIKSQTRLDLCGETVFCAVNYLDRFISLNQCQGWKSWMFELLSIACLSIATKFHETSAFLLHQFQEDLGMWFAPSLIQRMEITVLKSLNWRVDSVTPFSYIHLLTHTFNKTLVHELTQRVTHLLLHLLLDRKFMEFRQCVVAISAVKTVLFPSREHSSSFAHIDTLISQDHKDDLIRCQRLIREILVRDEAVLSCSNSCSSPSSPVTVLNLKVNLLDSYTHFSLKMRAMNVDLRLSRKRKREEGEEGL